MVDYRRDENSEMNRAKIPTISPTVLSRLERSGRIGLDLEHIFEINSDRRYKISRPMGEEDLYLEGIQTSPYHGLITEE